MCGRELMMRLYDMWIIFSAALSEIKSTHRSQMVTKLGIKSVCVLMRQSKEDGNFTLYNIPDS